LSRKPAMVRRSTDMTILAGPMAAVDGLIDDFHACGYGSIDLELDPLRVAAEVAVAASISVLLSDRETWDR
jgi:hypothetical protein